MDRKKKVILFTKNDHDVSEINSVNQESQVEVGETWYFDEIDKFDLIDDKGEAGSDVFE